ncbi:MAG: hypothetical protein C4289_11510 [Chloroflexota bacterium]|jgi:hypothetical protein
MNERKRKGIAAVGRADLKMPVNPSVLGTAKQAARAEKGGRTGFGGGAGGHPEGRGHPPGHGRGGKRARSHR